MHVSGVEIPGSRRGDFLSQWVEQEQGYCQNNSRKVVWLFWKWRYWPLRKVPLQKKRWILQNKYSSLCHFSFEFLQNNSWWHSQNIRVAALMMWLMGYKYTSLASWAVACCILQWWDISSSLINSCFTAKCERPSAPGLVPQEALWVSGQHADLGTECFLFACSLKQLNF